MPLTRRKFSKEFKVKVVQAYESGTSVAVLGREHELSPDLIYKWAHEYRSNPAGAFRDNGDASGQASEKRIAELERMIGRMAMEIEFLKKALKHAETVLSSKTPSNGTP